MTSNDRKYHSGQAQAAGGAAVTLGVPWVSRAEKGVMGLRLKRNAKQIERAKQNIPQRPPRGGTKITEPTRSKYGGSENKRVSSDIPNHPKSAPQREALRLARKSGYRKVRQLEAARKAISRPKIYPHQSKLWIGATAVGAPVSYLGAKRAVKAREQGLSKKLNEKDGTAAYAGGVGSGIAYQGGAMLTKPIDWKNEKKIAASPKHRATLAAHEAKYPRGTSAGDTKYREFFRHYPKNLPGGRMKRTFTHSHTGKSGGAITLGVIGAGAAGAVQARRMHEKKHTVQKSRASAFGVEH